MKYIPKFQKGRTFERDGFRYYYNYDDNKWYKYKIIPKPQFQEMVKHYEDSINANRYSQELIDYLYPFKEKKPTLNEFKNKEIQLSTLVSSQDTKNKPINYIKDTLGEQKIRIPIYAEPKRNPYDYYDPESSTWEKVNSYMNNKFNNLPGQEKFNELTKNTENFVKKKWKDWFGKQNINNERVNYNKEEMRQQISANVRKELLSKTNLTNKSNITNKPNKIKSNTNNKINSKQKLNTSNNIAFNIISPEIVIESIQKKIPNMMTRDTDYPTIKLRSTSSGIPISYVNSELDTIPVQQNGMYPTFTKEFAYPKLQHIKRNKLKVGEEVPINWKEIIASLDK